MLDIADHILNLMRTSVVHLSQNCSYHVESRLRPRMWVLEYLSTFCHFIVFNFSFESSG